MFVLILAASFATAPPRPPPPNPCTPAESCRYVDSFPLKDAQGLVHQVVFKQWAPYLQNGHLTLFPGEVVSLTLTDGGPVVTAATVLAAEDRDKPIEGAAGVLQKQTEQSGKEQVVPIYKGNLDPTNQAFVAEKDTLRVAFLQTEGGDMMLRIASGYGQVLAYRALITRPGRPTQSTSVCPVPASKFSIETWPPSLVAIELSDFQLQPTGSTAICR